MLTDPEAYRGLPEDFRDALDGWMFERYYQGLRHGGDLGLAPTPDVTVTLPEMVADIKAATTPWYVRLCDCRVLCGASEPAAKAHCLSHESGEGARAISTEEAVAIARQTDKEGFIHTRSPHGFCNCQADYCYLFRVRERRLAAAAREKTAVQEETAAREEAATQEAGTAVDGPRLEVQGRLASYEDTPPDTPPVLPAQDPSGWLVGSSVIVFDAERCTACGRCVKRCQFGVFEQSQSPTCDISARPERCIGCGVCVASCPVSALHLEKRNGIL